jgi:hypothetical protein
MKKILVGAAVFAAMVGAAPVVQAQDSGSARFGVSGGLTIPTGTVGDINGSGLNLQGHVNYKPATTPFGLRGDVGVFTTAAKTLPGVNGVRYNSTTWVTANANVMYNFEGAKDATFVPYVIGGLGFYNGGVLKRQTKFGLNVGGGVTFKLSGFDAFAEARFHNVYTDGFSSRLIPFSFGINFKP